MVIFAGVGRGKTAKLCHSD